MVNRRISGRHHGFILPVIEGTDFLKRLADLGEGAGLCAVADGEDQAHLTAVGDAEVLLHFALIVHADNAGGKTERELLFCGVFL